MLAQLTTAIGRLERIDIINLLFSLAHLWEQYPCVPEYLNALKDVQKKSVRAGLPFTNNLLTAIGSSSLLKETHSKGPRHVGRQGSSRSDTQGL